MNKNFANAVVVIGIIVILLGVVEYFTLVRRPSPVSSPELNVTTVQYSEPGTIANLKVDWQSVQALIPFRPVYNNSAQNVAGIWQTPYIVQFIGKGNIILEIEDDNNPYVVILHSDQSQFTLLESFKNQHNFTLSDYQNLLNKYGDSSYSVSTYSIGIMRNGQFVSFQDLTKVSDNLFLKGYSTAGNY